MTRELPSKIGPYRIVRRLGEGGMGVVYEAVNDDIERRVAIKCLNQQYAADEEATRRFFNEARAANRINHPSIVQISDYSTGAGGSPYIVMEFLAGKTLACILQDSSATLAQSNVLAIAWQIATALAAAHEKGIIHRDIKPENIMLVADPGAPGRQRVKILDFGVAKLASSNASKTGASVIMGTPRYMSPEQCKGSGQVDDRADCYSLGVMLFEMLSGRLPFLGEGAGELIAQHMYKEPPSLRDSMENFTPAVAELVDRMLRKTPGERPSMAEVAALFEALLAESNLSSGQGIGLAELTPKPAESASSLPVHSSTLRGEVSSGGNGSMLIGALAALGLTLLVGAAAVTRGLGSTMQKKPPSPEQSERAALTSQAALTAAQSTVVSRKRTWRIHSVPSGAWVLDANGTSLGQTPLISEQVPRPGEQTLTLRLLGYVDRVIVLRLDKDHDVSELLRPVQKKALRVKKDADAELDHDPTKPNRRTSYED